LDEVCVEAAVDDSLAAMFSVVVATALLAVPSLATKVIVRG
jgi:hypothetical protein